MASPAHATTYEDYLAGFLDQPVQARKQIDMAGIDAARLERDSRSANGTNPLGAQILLGWKRHGKLYEETLGVRIKNQVGQESLVRLSSRTAQDPRLLGLVLELVLDPAVTNPIRRDAEVYAQLLVTPRAAEFRAPLLGALSKAKDNSVRGSIARLVAATEPDPAKLAELAKAEFARDAPSTAVSDNLLSGAADRIDKLEKPTNKSSPRAPATPEAETSDSKDAVAQSLREALAAAEGADRVEIVHSLGDMGAEKADELIAEYLQGDIPDSEQAWAITRLANRSKHRAERHVVGTGRAAATAVANEMAKTMVPAALTSGVSPARINSKIITGSVTSNRDSRSAMMNSSQDSVNDRQNTARIDGNMIGMITRRMVARSPAPRSWAALSMLRR